MQNESGDEHGELALGIGKSSKIMKSQVKSMIFNVILIVEQDCNMEEFPCGMHHHGNVEVRSGNMVVNVTKPDWGSLDVYQDNLTTKLAKISSLTDGRIFAILKDIAEGVKRLHEMKKPHGKIIPDNVFLSTDERNHPYLRGSEESNSCCNPQDDIKDLGKLFYYVLTNGLQYTSPQASSAFYLECNEKHTAWDLLSKMINDEDIKMQDVLAHPMFFSDNEKLQYVADVYDSVSHDRKSLKALDNKAIGLVFKSEWKTDLKMTKQEKNNCNSSTNPVDMDRIFRMAGGGKTKKRKNLSWKVYLCDGEKLKNVDMIEEKKWNSFVQNVPRNGDKEPGVPSEETIVKIISKNEELKGKECEIFSPVILFREEEDGGYDGTSFYDLLRFIRNRKAHYLEADQLAKTCFNAAGGLWKFFISQSRYPKLLIFIHNNMGYFPHYHSSN